MRTFVYKTLIVIISIFLLYQLTIGYTVYNFQKKIFSSLDKESIEYVKDKIRQEINKSISKERVINKEDSILLRKFIDKIKDDLKNINWLFNNIFFHRIFF